LGNKAGKLGSREAGKLRDMEEWKLRTAKRFNLNSPGFQSGVEKVNSINSAISTTEKEK